MGAGKVILNPEDLMEYLKDKIEFNLGDLSLGDFENVLRDYMELIVDYLEQILNLLKKKGIQESIAVNMHIPAIRESFELSRTFDKDILLTGVTYSQSAWKYQDTWDLVVGDKILYQYVGTKEIGESKQLNVFYFVPKGTPVKAILRNRSGNSRLVWFDFEYIDADGYGHIPIPPLSGKITIRYINAETGTVLSEEVKEVNFGVHMIYPEKVPSEYTLVEPKYVSIVISGKNREGTADFTVKPVMDNTPTDPEGPIIYPDDDPKEIKVYHGEMIPVGYVDITPENINQHKLLQFTMEFGTLSGVVFPDMQLQFVSKEGEERYGYNSQFLSNERAGSISLMLAGHSVDYTGWASHPEVFTINRPNIGRYYFYVQNLGGSKDSTVKFKVTAPYKSLYVLNRERPVEGQSSPGYLVDPPYLGKKG